MDVGRAVQGHRLRLQVRDQGRDDFEKLLADLRTGAFGKASDISSWEISRLARETGKGVEIVDRREARGYMIHITSHERTYNPENHNDRHELIKGIADEEKEARLLSKRTKRGTDSALSEGACTASGRSGTHAGTR
ncbi:recombinase family protein [Streptomyces sp. T1317-0309]|nr:recombinase family protein [Streptomyces sp. T1317-0309]